MGGEFWTTIIQETDKDKVQNSWEEICNFNHFTGDIYDGFSSLVYGKNGPLQFIETPICKTDEEARDYLLTHHRKWDAAMVIQYWTTVEELNEQGHEAELLYDGDNGKRLVSLVGGWAAA